MAASKHLGIRDTAAALLAGLVPADRILENRELPLPSGVESQIHVFRVISLPQRGVVMGAPIDWSTQVRIVVKARKGVSSAEVIADGLSVSCYERLLADQTLGGLAMDLQPGALAWDQDAVDPAVAQVTLDVIYVHRTTQHLIS